MQVRGNDVAEAVPAPHEREWFERLPWTTMFVLSVLYWKEGDYLSFAIKSELEELGFPITVDMSLVSNLTLESALAPENFHTYTLESKHIQTTIAASILIVSVFGILAQIFMGERVGKNSYSKDDAIDAAAHRIVRKRMSWVLSMFNSGFLTIIGFYYLNQKCGFMSDLSQVSTYLSDDTWRHKDGLWSGIDNFGAVIMIYFFCFNIMELIYGSMVAPEFLDPITAWVHHPMFCLIMVTGLTGNVFPFGEMLVKNIFVPLLGAENAVVSYMQTTILPATSSIPFTAPFMIPCIEELPTFILALGSVFPSLRSDALFGFTFFILRIVFHAFLLYNCPYSIKAVFLSISMVMQLAWFGKWVTSYLPKLLKGNPSKAKSQ
jgi:hypothetical protein